MCLQSYSTLSEIKANLIQFVNRCENTYCQTFTHFQQQIEPTIKIFFLMNN